MRPVVTDSPSRLPAIAPRWCLAVFCLGVIAALVVGSATAWARPEAVRWLVNDGVFDEASNWESGRVPDAGDLAVFAPDGSIAVSLASSAHILGLEMESFLPGDEGPVLTFSLNGHDFRIGREDDSGGSNFRLNSTSSSGPRVIRFEGGTVISPVISLSTRDAADSLPARLELGDGALMQVSRYFYIGNKGEGIVSLEGTGTLESTGHLRLGESEGSIGRVSVSGPEAQLICGLTEPTRRGIAFIGSRGEGELKVTDGAKVEGLLIQLGRSSLPDPSGHGRGKLLVTGEGSVLRCAHLFVGGGRSSLMRTEPLVRDGVGVLSVLDGGSLEAGELRLFGGSELSFDLVSFVRIVGISRGSESGSTLFEPGSIVHLVLSGKPSSAPLHVVGPLEMAGVTLKLTLPEQPLFQSGEVIALVDYTGGELMGEFVGLSDGATVATGSHAFTINYGRDGTRLVTLKAQ